MRSQIAATLVGLRYTMTAVAAVSLTLALMTSQIAAAQPLGTNHVTSHKAHLKPTIVLEHGAWASTGSWDGVIARVQRAGYTVYAPTDPLRGVSIDAGYLADFLATIPGPIVLVGHSYGGIVITNAAYGNKNVKALVYDDAFVPAEGETAGQLTNAQPGSCLGGNPVPKLKLVPYRGSPAGDYNAFIKQSVFPGCFANDLPAKTGAILGATQNPAVVSLLFEKSGPPAWKSIPSWSIVGTVDRVIPPAEQLFMSKRAGAHITKIRASHLSMISQPGAVTNVILAAARATN
jgi:pimeloyl-ACP methyl ester carboxylesterase